MNKECKEFNKKLYDEVYERKYQEYIELKKWLKIDDGNIKNK